MEFDIVPPALLPILAERGVEILPPHKGMGKACEEAYQKFLDEKPKFQKATGDVEAPNEYDVAVRDKLIDDYLKPAGIGLYSDAEAEKILEENKSDVKMSQDKKNAAETAPLIQKEGSPADISTASGAKILKNLESYANKLEKVVNRRRNFLDEVGHELEACCLCLCKDTNFLANHNYYCNTSPNILLFLPLRIKGTGS